MFRKSCLEDQTCGKAEVDSLKDNQGWRFGHTFFPYVHSHFIGCVSVAHDSALSDCTPGRKTS